eukprot:366085-Chlamydomonas_euryale.AAC.13
MAGARHVCACPARKRSGIRPPRRPCIRPCEISSRWGMSLPSAAACSLTHVRSTLGWKIRLTKPMDGDLYG